MHGALGPQVGRDRESKNAPRTRASGSRLNIYLSLGSESFGPRTLKMKFASK